MSRINIFDSLCIIIAAALIVLASYDPIVKDLLQ